jgi:DNA-binding beta-propeller fold protein YncE
VADYRNNRIQKFTSAGAFVATWGSYGTGNGQFSTPKGVAVDGAGNIYIADTGNSRVQKFRVEHPSYMYVSDSAVVAVAVAVAAVILKKR